MSKLSDRIREYLVGAHIAGVDITQEFLVGFAGGLAFHEIQDTDLVNTIGIVSKYAYAIDEALGLTGTGRVSPN